ncbi:hypothetical protein Ae505Ps2_2387 [Pseudonocardia sp. Ae505_Ps2]|nr:hypothetical protein Ae505Ps2_2387 [Pseudonocardia sp. Ae505_Ps2]
MCAHRRAVEAEAGVGREIAELPCAGHADDPQPIFEDPGFHRADPR